MSAPHIPLEPILTEQSVRDQEQNQATFRVASRATKYDIARAVQEIYHVKPIAIRTARFKPKQRRRGATVGATRAWKKAYVSVPDIKALNLVP